MFYKISSIVILVCLISGCATELKRDVHKLESDIAENRAKISNASNDLRKNPDVYNGSYCVTPSRGPEPKYSCHNEDDSRKKGLVACALAYKGCDVVVSSFKDKLNGKDKQFLASQACEFTLAEMQGELRGAGDVMVDGAIEIAKNSCDGDGFFKYIGCLYAGAGEIYKFAQFSSCVTTKANRCFENYKNWLNKPAQRKAACEENLYVIRNAQENISVKTKIVNEKKDTFMWKMFGD